MKKNSGIDYAPESHVAKAKIDNDYVIAAIGIDHGHIFGMLEGLIDAGAIIKYIIDTTGIAANNLKLLKEKYPEAQVMKDITAVMKDPEVNLICTSTINSERFDIAQETLKNKKDVFIDKPAITSLENYNVILNLLSKVENKLYIYYGELIHNESALYAQKLIKDGVIGKVIQVIGTGPHREGGKGSRQDWFYTKEQFGGIICDIGSHQVAQFLAFSNSSTATLKYSHVGNYEHSDQPEFEDFGEFNLIGNNGTSGYFRVDWFTPAGLSSWSDGRMIIMGTKGTIELRKYCDVAIENHGENNVYLVDEKGEYYFDVNKKVGFNYFKNLIEDSLHKDLNILDQKEILEPTYIALIAQEHAEYIGWKNE